MRSPRLLFLLVLLTSAFSPPLRTAEPAELTVATAQSYRGWRDAIIVSNGLVEAVIVPSLGRVMQFRFVGEADGPFWENENLLGQPMPADPWKAAHGSFGGDKTWPAPQSLWNWPPPDIFDRTAVNASVSSDHSVTLVSEASPRFGLRTIRRITLERGAPAMHIATTYEKTAGDPLNVSVWIITQLRVPVASFLPVPLDSKFPTGLAPQWPAPAGAMQRHGDLLRFVRDPKKSYKVGNDAAAIIWVGERHVLRISTDRLAGADYPDGGCIAEFYANADPVPYVEHETVGPLKTLRPGDSVSATNHYVLARRSSKDPVADARALLTPKK